VIYVEQHHDIVTWLLDESGVVPWGKLMIHILVLAIITTHAAIVTQGLIQGFLPICTHDFWVMWTVIWPIVGVMTTCVVAYFIWLDNRRREVGIPRDTQSLFTVKKSMFICAFSLFAGILSSLLGIGGGILLSPLMLELGVSPDATAATSSFMILWTSLAAIIQFILDSRLPYDYSPTYLGLGFISSIVGQVVMSALVKKYNKRSFIVFCILVVIILSTILLFTTGTIQVVEQIRLGIDLGFTPFCKIR